MTETQPVDVDEFKILLEARCQELQEIRKTSGDARAVVELDQQSVGRLSRMDALQGQAMALEQDRRREQELARVDAALARIASGDFGFCIACDEPISEKRLRLDPAIPTCIDCAAGDR